MKNRYLHPLTEQAREYFKDFKNHPAVPQGYFYLELDGYEFYK